MSYGQLFLFVLARMVLLLFSYLFTCNKQIIQFVYSIRIYSKNGYYSDAFKVLQLSLYESHTNDFFAINTCFYDNQKH